MTNTNVMAMGMQAEAASKGGSRSILKGPDTSKGNFDEALGRLQQEAQGEITLSDKDEAPQDMDARDGGSGREGAPHHSLVMGAVLPVQQLLSEDVPVEAPAAVIEFSSEAPLSGDLIKAQDIMPEKSGQSLRSLLPQSEESAVKNSDFLAMLSGDLTSSQRQEARGRLSAAWQVPQAQEEGVAEGIRQQSEPVPGKMFQQQALPTDVQNRQNIQILGRSLQEAEPTDPLALALRQTARTWQQASQPEMQGQMEQSERVIASALPDRTVQVGQTSQTVQMTQQMPPQVTPQVLQQVTLRMSQQIMQQIPQQATQQVSQQVMQQVAQPEPKQVMQQVPQQATQQLRLQMTQQVSHQQVTQQMSPQAAQQVPQQTTQPVSQQVTQQMPQQVTQQIPQQVTQQMPQQVTQQMPRQVTQQMPQQVTQQMPQQVTQQMPQQVTQQMPRQVTQQMPQQVTQQMPRQVTQQMPQQVTQQMPQQVTQQMPQQVTQQMPRQVTQQMPQQVTQQMPQQVTQQMPQQVTQQMPQQVTQQMPQQVTQQMSQQVEQQMPQQVTQQMPQQAAQPDPQQAMHQMPQQVVQPVHQQVTQPVTPQLIQQVTQHMSQQEIPQVQMASSAAESVAPRQEGQHVLLGSEVHAEQAEAELEPLRVMHNQTAQGESSFQQNQDDSARSFERAQQLAAPVENEEGAVPLQAAQHNAGAVQGSNFQQQLQEAAAPADTPQATSESQTDFEVPRQIVEQARLIRSGDSTEMVIHLKPEHLGDLTLKISVTEGGAVTASFHSDNAQVRTIIENSLVQLRQELSDQGLKVDSVEVFSGLPDGQLPQGQGQQAWQQGSQGRFSGERKPEDYAEEADDLAAAALAQGQENVADDGVDYRV
ncbi:flagellar hook-length control protein FliK [Selenomonas sp. AB3002]|uniref:flagellar hook-length control protein FliK n=1 Tax=Selenomonas sp. AB3002 TaxID=1392502 RepID=UPI00068BDD91